MRTKALLLAALVLSMMGETAVTLPTSRPSNGEEVRLWPGKAPRAQGDKPADIPALTCFFPDAAKANGTAIVICPGGGYSGLSMTSEGTDEAHWFNDHGIAAFVLKYRVSPYGQPVPMLDGQRAIRVVRHNATDWGINPKRIGIMGFSAGGHVASTVGTHYDDGLPKPKEGPFDPVLSESCKPDFMILVYPVITMKDKITHEGSRHVLLGDKPGAVYINLYSNELHVDKDTPPTFIAASKTDTVVPVKNSELFADALKKNKVPYEFVELETGDHGYGMAANDPKVSVWTDKCMDWLKGRGLLERAK
jgi:acetyl esterase/lipase